MASLVTVADIEARLGRELTPAEEARIDAMLMDASALVRSYTRQDFTFTEDDNVVTRPVGTVIRLPKTPVTEVRSVSVVTGDGLGTSTALAGWSFDGIDKVDVAGLDTVILNLPEWWSTGWGPNTYRVTYSHGYLTVPDDVVAVTCATVVRVLLSPSQIAGMVGENIGKYSYQLQQGTGAAGASVVLLPEHKAVLDGYRRDASTIQLEV